MPLIQYQLPVFVRKLLGFRQVMQSEAVRFPQLHPVCHVKNCLSTCLYNMHVNRLMVVTIETEAKSVFFKYLGHC